MKTILSRRFSIVLLGVLCAMSLVKVAADQGFFVIGQARPGMLMTVNANDPNVAEPAVAERAEALVGVLGDQPTSFDFQDGQQNVLTGGVRDTIISTVYGDIKKGDYITASSIAGLGGKLIGSGWVIGIAQSDFNSTSPGAVMTTATGLDNQQKEVYAGSIPVLIKVLYYDDSAAVKERDVSFIPEKLQKTIDTIAGRRASLIAVLLAFLLIITGLFVGGLIVYSAIKNGIASTARQPLAKQAIVQRMFQSCVIGFVIILAAVFGAFILIRLF